MVNQQVERFDHQLHPGILQQPGGLLQPYDQAVVLHLARYSRQLVSNLGDDCPAAMLTAEFDGFRQAVTIFLAFSRIGQRHKMRAAGGQFDPVFAAGTGYGISVLVPP